MTIQAISPEGVGEAHAYPAERSVFVAALLTMSSGFLDAFTWLSFDVFASSHTGNVVFVGVYAMSGQWQQVFHHLLPIAAFLIGASLAIHIRTPLLCLAGEIGCLSVTMLLLLLHRVPEMITIPGLAFGVALQSASFRHVERWNYLSVAMTGNLLRAVDDSAAAMSDPSAWRGTGIMFLLCLTFLSGAIVGAFMTKWLGAWSLFVPIASSACALWFCHLRRS